MESSTEQDDNLFEYNARFQAAILSSMDNQLATMEDQIAEKDHELSDVRKTKEMLGVALYKVQQEMSRLRNSVQQTREDLRESEHAKLLAIGESSRLKQKLSAASKETQNLQSRLDQATSQVSSLQEGKLALESLTTVYKSNMKIHHTTEKGLEGELGDKQAAIDSLRQREKDLVKTVERLSSEKKSVEEELRAQEAETRVSQRQLCKVVDDLQAVTAAKTVLLSKWREAVEAMSARDAALHSVQDRAVAGEEARDAAVAAERAAAAEAEELGRQLARERGRAEQSSAQAMQLKSSLVQLSQQHSALKEEHDVQSSAIARLDRQARRAAQAAAAEMRAMDPQKQRHLLDAAVLRVKRKEGEVAELSRETLRLQKQHEEHIHRAEEAIAAKERWAMREKERANNQIQRMSASVQAAERELDVTRAEALSLAHHASHVESELAAVSNSAAVLRDALPVKDRSINKLASDLQKSERAAAAAAATHRQVVSGLERTIEERGRTIKLLQQQWVGVQEELLVARRATARHGEKRAMAVAESRTHSAMNVGLRRERRGLSKALLRTQMENDEVRTAMRAVNSRAGALSAANAGLKAELVNTRSVLHVREAEFEAGSAALKNAVSTLRQQRKEAVGREVAEVALRVDREGKLQHTSERLRHVEGECRSLRAEVEGLRMEVGAAKQEKARLQKQLDIHVNRFKEMFNAERVSKLQSFTRSAAKSGRPEARVRAKQLQQILDSSRPANAPSRSPSRDTRGGSGGGGGGSGSSSRRERELHEQLQQQQSELHRLRSQSAQRLHQVVTLKQRVEDLEEAQSGSAPASPAVSRAPSVASTRSDGGSSTSSRRTSRQGRAEAATAARAAAASGVSAAVTAELAVAAGRSQAQRLVTATRQCTRARCLAASLERQLVGVVADAAQAQGVAPHELAVVDYSFDAAAVPSAALRRALDGYEGQGEGERQQQQGQQAQQQGQGWGEGQGGEEVVSPRLPTLPAGGGSGGRRAMEKLPRRSGSGGSDSGSGGGGVNPMPPHHRRHPHHRRRLVAAHGGGSGGEEPIPVPAASPLRAVGSAAIGSGSRRRAKGNGSSRAPAPVPPPQRQRQQQRQRSHLGAHFG